MKPLIVCLCGSTRFRQEFEDVNQRETLLGHIVLAPAVFMHDQDVQIPTDVKERLDELHRHKIDLADEVIILNIGGYIGKSTRNEIAYATETHKPIRWEVPVE